MANIEQWAIDLSWDIIARFSSATPEGSDEALPQGFYDDFVQVACEEAKVKKTIAQINKIKATCMFCRRHDKKILPVLNNSQDIHH